MAFLLCRAGRVKAPYLCGRRAMEAARTTTVTATATPTASTLCPSAARLRMATCRGTRSSARLRWRPPTAAGRRERSRSSPPTCDSDAQTRTPARPPARR